jgi:ribosome-associated protein
VCADHDGAVSITSTTSIPEAELSFRFSRSSGPGGQHVNRTETRVELVFDLAHSPSMRDDQRARALQRLAPYVDKRGVLHLVSQSSRSQLRNREEVVARFQALLRGALKVPKKRYSTAPSRAERERRLESKRQRSEIKRRRRRVLVDAE